MLIDKEIAVYFLLIKNFLQKNPYQTSLYRQWCWKDNKWLRSQQNSRCDMMSIRFLNVCRDSIYKPLGLMLRVYLQHGVLPQNWKISNAVINNQ